MMRKDYDSENWEKETENAKYGLIYSSPLVNHRRPDLLQYLPQRSKISQSHV